MNKFEKLINFKKTWLESYFFNKILKRFKEDNLINPQV